MFCASPVEHFFTCLPWSTILTFYSLHPFGFSDACEYFATQLSPLGEDEREDWLEKVVDYIQKQSLNAPFVEKSLIESAILVTSLCSYLFVDI